MRREIHRFNLTYFKDTGKYYSEATQEYNTLMCEDVPTVYMYDYIDHIRKRREGQSQGDALPGLSSLWLEGFVLIETEDGFPHLLLPVKDNYCEIEEARLRVREQE